MKTKPISATADRDASESLRSSVQQLVSLVACAALLAITASLANAQDRSKITSGYLCCNMRVYNDWISDINYRFDGTGIIPTGTRAWVKGTGRYSFTLAMAGKTRTLGNDYSRSMTEREFLSRYLVSSSPRKKIQTWNEDVQTSVKRMRVMLGMTEEQVLTSIGYPPHNYTPDLKGKVWQYWLDSSSQFNIHWNAKREVKRVEAEKETRRRVMYWPKPKPKKEVAPPVELKASTPLESTPLDGHYQLFLSSRNFKNTVR